jgi:hypothetical protein
MHIRGRVAGPGVDMSLRVLFVLLALLAAMASPVAAQAPPANAPADAAAQDDAPDADADLNLSQPDFTVITLPTTLRVPRFKSAFRVTHRFGRPLGQGDFGNLAEDLFGLDSGALIGLEYRFGLARGWQAGIYRTSDRTIQFFTHYNLWRQADHPVGVSVVASAEGTNNFRDSYSPGVGVVVSRELGEYGALYFQPIWVNNTNPLPSEVVDDNDTLLLGVGARIRVRPTVYLVGEVIPRVGYAPGATQGSFGIEKRAGGHTFQLNFSNGAGTTWGQVARGGTASDDWYLGFQISRKFF